MWNVLHILVRISVFNDTFISDRNATFLLSTNLVRGNTNLKPVRDYSETVFCALSHTEAGTGGLSKYV